MGLTKEQISGILPDLTDDQFSQIDTLQQKADTLLGNSERGKAFQSVDDTLSLLTGIKRNEGEKTTDFSKRLVTQYKDAHDSVATITQEVKDLKKQIADGKGDESIKQQLKDAQTALEAAKAARDTVETEWKGKYEKLNSEVMSMKIEADFAPAWAGKDKADGLSEEDFKILVKAKQDTILAKYKPDLVDGKIVYRDPSKNNEAVMGKDLNPATGASLLSGEISSYLKEERKATGNGTHSPQGVSGKTGFRLTATTQVMADEQIDQHVVSEGIDRRSLDFQKRVTEIRKDNKVDSLPMQ